MYRLIGADHVEYGPVTAAQLGEWVSQGRANGATLVWTEGAADWMPLSTLPEFAHMRGPAAAPPAAIRPAVVTRPKTNGLAVAGLVFGILSVPLLSCFFFFSILGIVFSAIGMAQINRSAGRETGRGMAITGIVLSCLGLLLAVLVYLALGALGAMGGSS